MNRYLISKDGKVVYQAILFWDADEEHLDYEDVTHWMPLVGPKNGTEDVIPPHPRPDYPPINVIYT